MLHHGPMWGESNMWESFKVKTSPLIPGKPTIKWVFLTGETKNYVVCNVDFELPANVEVEDSFETFVSFLLFFVLKKNM